MSNLRHVADLVAGELHHMDVIRGRLFAGRLARTTGTGMSTRKDTVGSDVVALGISGKGLHLTAAVRHNRHLEDGKLTVFKRFVFYAHIRTSDSGKYIWRSLKTTNEQIARVSKFWWEYAGELAVEAIDDSLLANSSLGARRPSLWLGRTGMNRFLPLP